MNHFRDQRTLTQILETLPISSLQTVQEAQLFCDYIGYSTTPDIRHQIWQVNVESLNPFVVRGQVSNAHALNTLIEASERLGKNCDTSQVVSLPDKQLGDRRFGLVTYTECPLYKTIDKQEQVEGALYGESLFLLKHESSMSLVYAQNGYAGWVDSINYRTLSQDEWIQWYNHDRVLFVCDLNYGGVKIPGGTELPHIENNQVQLPTGTSLEVDMEILVETSQMAKQQRSALFHVAQTLMNSPYKWGGVTSAGIDCSAFVRHLYRNIGINLPRDADQQFTCGRISALPGVLGCMKAGDLVFFSGACGGVSHVGMAISPESFIHAGKTNGVTVSRWEDEKEFEERFLMAKRIIR